MPHDRTITITSMLPSLLLLLSLALLHKDVNAFEVPFPQSSLEIRGLAVLGPRSATRRLPLGSGTTAEVVSCRPPARPDGDADLFSLLRQNFRPRQGAKPVLVFLHGSFHASWCWEEKYLPHFASLGYPCVALSLQGTGGTPAVDAGATKVQISSHVADLDALLRGLSDDGHALGLELGKAPPIVLVGHSFGGLTIMKWLERYYGEAGPETQQEDPRGINLAGVALLCSVPPSGNGPMTLRFLRRSLRQSWTITAGFVLKRALTDGAVCRELFFGGAENANGISDEDVGRYQGYFARDSAATIDLRDLAGRLPSRRAREGSGAAPFVERLPSKSLVVAASDDFIVDGEGSRETARYFGVGDPVVVESPHDVMLGDSWENGADALLTWIRGLQSR